MGAATAACAYLWMHFLCVPPEYAHSYLESAMYVLSHPVKTDDQSARTGVHIELFDTDSFVDAPDAAFEHVCSHGVCFAYRKHCETSTACLYTVPQPHIVQFWVRAKTTRLLRLAQRRILYQANGVSIPLSALTADTSASIRIGCPHPYRYQMRSPPTERIQGCQAN